jgi:hypothetical protein
MTTPEAYEIVAEGSAAAAERSVAAPEPCEVVTEASSVAAEASAVVE